MDTLKIVDILTAEGTFTDVQAKKIARIVSEAKHEDLNDIATKAFVRADISDAKVELIKWMFGITFTIAGMQLGILILVLKVFFKGAGAI